MSVRSAFERDKGDRRVRPGRSGCHRPGPLADERVFEVTLEELLGRDCWPASATGYVMWTLRDPAAAVARWIRLLSPGGVIAMADSLWFTDGLGDLYGEHPAGHCPWRTPARSRRSRTSCAAAGSPT